MIRLSLLALVAALTIALATLGCTPYEGWDDDNPHDREWHSNWDDDEPDPAGTDAEQPAEFGHEHPADPELPNGMDLVTPVPGEPTEAVGPAPTQRTDGIDPVGRNTPQDTYVAIMRGLGARDGRAALTPMTEYGRAELVFGLAMVLQMVKAQSDMVDEAMGGQEMPAMPGMPGMPGGQVETNPLKRTADRWVQVKRDHGFTAEALQRAIQGNRDNRQPTIDEYRRLRNAAGLLRDQVGALNTLFDQGGMPEGAGSLGMLLLSSSASDQEILANTTTQIDGDVATVTIVNVDEETGEREETHQQYVRLAQHGNAWFFDCHVDEPLRGPEGEDTPEEAATPADERAANDGVQPVGGDSARDAYVRKVRALANQDGRRAMAFMTEHGRALTVFEFGLILELLMEPRRQAVEHGLTNREITDSLERWETLVSEHRFSAPEAREVMEEGEAEARRRHLVHAYRGLTGQPALLSGMFDVFFSQFQLGDLPASMVRFAEASVSDAEILRHVTDEAVDENTVVLIIRHPADEGEEAGEERERYVRASDGRWYYDGNG